MRSARVTAQGSAAGAPARSLSGRIARMAAVAGTCAMVLFGHGIGAGAGAQEPAADEPVAYGEYLVKAAFLYNFAKFTKWPSGTYADASAPLVFCVLGKDAFGRALDSIAGKRLNGRRVALSRLARVKEAVQCQVLFISESVRQAPAHRTDRASDLAQRTSNAEIATQIGERCVTACPVLFQLSTGEAARHVRLPLERGVKHLPRSYPRHGHSHLASTDAPRSDQRGLLSHEFLLFVTR